MSSSILFLDATTNIYLALLSALLFCGLGGIERRLTLTAQKQELCIHVSYVVCRENGFPLERHLASLINERVFGGENVFVEHHCRKKFFWINASHKIFHF